MDPLKMKIVYVVTPRNGRNFWTRIGVAFVNRDGSLNVKLEAMPVSGEIHIRDSTPKEESFGSTTLVGGTSLVDRPSNGNGNGHGHASTADSDSLPAEFA